MKESSLLHFQLKSKIYVGFYKNKVPTALLFYLSFRKIIFKKLINLKYIIIFLLNLIS